MTLAVHGNVKRIYSPWTVVVGWLETAKTKYRPKSVVVISSETRFPLAFVPTTLNKVHLIAPSKLFLVQRLTIRLYRFKDNPSIRDNSSISLKDSSYLVACCPSVLIY